LGERLAETPLLKDWRGLNGGLGLSTSLRERLAVRARHQDPQLEAIKGQSNGRKPPRQPEKLAGGFRADRLRGRFHRLRPDLMVCLSRGL
jgi:hypothetical protein